MTLNGVINPNGTVISANSVAFGADYVKVVEDTQILSAAERSPRNVVFLRYNHLWRYCRGSLLARALK